MKEVVPDNGEPLPLDVCYVLKEGTDVTLVTWGAMCVETLAVANKLAEEGISAEVIDVVTIKPLDIGTIIESIEKTGRCVIIQEANPTCSVSADIAAQVAEKALTSLMAPIVRVTGYDTVMPLYQLEKTFLPSEARILQGIKNVLEYI